MICPKCGKNDMQYIVSTRRRSPDYILRRRECECGHRFSTIEIAELNENSMQALDRLMRKNSKPRAFEKTIHQTYRSIFDRSRYLAEKRNRAVINYDT